MPDKEKDSSSNIQKLIKNMNIEKISEVTKNPEYKKIIEENRDTQLADIPEIKEEKRNSYEADLSAELRREMGFADTGLKEQGYHGVKRGVKKDISPEAMKGKSSGISPDAIKKSGDAARLRNYKA